MYKKIFSICAILLLLAGLFVPLWYAAVAGLLMLSVILPFLGVCVGSLLDIIYGAPPAIPAALAFPCTISAFVVGLASLFVRRYIR